MALLSRSSLPQMGGSSRRCKQKGRFKALELGNLQLRVLGSFPGRMQLPPQGATALTVWDEVWPHGTPPEEKETTCREVICRNSDFTWAFPADGPDLQKVCRHSLKYDFCFSGDLEFFVSLTIPMAIYWPDITGFLWNPVLISSFLIFFKSHQTLVSESTCSLFTSKYNLVIKPYNFFSLFLLSPF